MMIKKTLNHNKLYRPYAIGSSSVNNFKCNKRLFSIMTETNYDYNYKKQKLNNRFQTTSSYIKPSVLDNNIQWKYDIGIIKKKIDDKLIQKPDGYRRDGIIFEKVLGIIYENEGYTVTPTGGTNDAGVDLIAEKDSKKIAIQAKNYNDNMTSKYLNKNNIEVVFNKIKNDGELKHLGPGKSFYGARLHIYNDNIVNMRPQFVENIAIKHQYDIFDKMIYGKTWLLNYTNCLTQNSIKKFYDLFDK